MIATTALTFIYLREHSAPKYTQYMTIPSLLRLRYSFPNSVPFSLIPFRQSDIWFIWMASKSLEEEMHLIARDNSAVLEDDDALYI